MQGPETFSEFNKIPDNVVRLKLGTWRSETMQAARSQRYGDV